MKDIKTEILDEILKCSPVHRKVNGEMYRIRCPICGDSQKNQNDMHCYIKCSNDPNEPLLYICFLCNSKGRINKWFLDKLGASPKVSKSLQETTYNRLPSIKTSDVEILTGKPIMNSPQVEYIERRLGHGFIEEDYDRMKIVWDMNLVSQYIRDQKTKNTLPNNRDSISFISDDKTAMLSRTFLDSSKLGHQWRKIRILSTSTHSYYAIKTQIDLFSKDLLYVNIAEGIFDILSVFKNFNDGANSVFFAALGSDYISTLEYIIAKGFIGTNVIVKIYIDQGIREKELFNNLKKFKWMFNTIYVYKNVMGKDVGERLETIKLQEKRI